MRPAEWINTLFFLFLIALAWRRPLIPARRAKVTAWGIAVIGVVLGAQYIHRLFSPLAASVIRDWLPALLILAAYWAAGQFYASPNERLQDRLIQFDRKVLRRLKPYPANTGLSGWVAAYFELAYLLCYPLLPFGLGALYVARMGRYADEFWTIVLSSAYLCYAALPFAQTLPPRTLTKDGDAILPPTKVRELNLWILHHGSIQVNTFPSAHVATALSVSLVLLRLWPAVGIAFLWVSFSIAAGAVLGRYHYAADVLLAAALAIGVFLIQAICY